MSAGGLVGSGRSSGIIGKSAADSLDFPIGTASRRFRHGRERGTQVCGGRLRRIGVDEATGAPLKAGHFRQARNNLDMPVIVVMRGAVKRQSMQKVVVGNWSDSTFNTTNQVPHNPRKFAKLRSF